MHQLDQYVETLIRQQRAAAQADLERRQLVRAALSLSRWRFYQPAIVGLGQRLVVWGIWLQRHATDLRLPAEITLTPQNE